MGLIGLIVGLTMIGLVVPRAVQAILDPILLCAWATLMAVTLTSARARGVVATTVVTQWPSALLFAGFLAWLGYQMATAANPAAALAGGQMTLLTLAGLALAALVAAAATARNGPTAMLNALLIGACAAGLLTLFRQNLNPENPVPAAGLAVLFVVSVFAAIASLRRSNTAASPDTVGRARRMFLPVSAVLCCAVGLASVQQSANLAAAVVGAAGTAAVYATRLRNPRRTQAWAIAGAAIVLLLGFYGLVWLATNAPQHFTNPATAGALALWSQNMLHGLGLNALSTDPFTQDAPAGVQLLVEAGVVGACLLGTTGLLFFLTTIVANASDARPAAGGALCAGVILASSISALQLSDLSQAPQALAVAVILGVAASYTERKKATTGMRASLQLATPGTHRL
jgi:hypothetical protein